MSSKLEMDRLSASLDLSENSLAFMERTDHADLELARCLDSSLKEAESLVRTVKVRPLRLRANATAGQVEQVAQEVSNEFKRLGRYEELRKVLVRVWSCFYGCDARVSSEFEALKLVIRYGLGEREFSLPAM